MSLSRWSYSCWYVFDSVEGGLSINSMLFAYDDLIENKEAVLDYHRQERFNRNPRGYYGPGVPPIDRFTEEEIQELSGIIDQAIENYEPKGYQTHDFD